MLRKRQPIHGLQPVADAVQHIFRLSVSGLSVDDIPVDQGNAEIYPETESMPFCRIETAVTPDYHGAGGLHGELRFFPGVLVVVLQTVGQFVHRF